MSDLESTLKQCGLFNGLSNSDVTACAGELLARKFMQGEVLIEKDHEAMGLIIIHSGKAGIYNEDILLSEVGSGAVIGESFIAGLPATATIIALLDMETFIILKDDFFRMIKSHPQIIQNVFSLSLNRLRKSNEIALQDARQRTEQLKQLVDERTSELMNTLEELKHTQQFRDQFLANMSHEIRTPMNAIVGLTNLLVQSPLNEQQEKYLQVIKKSGDNLLVIINDILDLSKIEAGKMELEHVSFPLRNAIENLQTILALKAKEKGIELNVIIDDEVPDYVIGDETRLTQILMNLTGNAIKFTEKGAVTIAVKYEGKQDDAVRLLFSVQDTGIGIPDDKLGRIFESFGQASTDTTRKYGGTGLGLSISKQLVELHNSELKVSSTIGEGSVFYFSILFTPSQAPQTPLQDDQIQNPELEHLKILLVEDNAFNQMVANDTLESLFPGVQVDIAENGRTAIALATANEYHLILMDLQLPDIDGFEITRFIRREVAAPKNKVPICAMTASVSKDRIDACFVAGMDDYLFKPFTQNDLRERVLKHVLVKKTSRYDLTKEFILDKLKRELSPQLQYHSLEHILDVLRSVEVLGPMEQVSEDELELLKVAALYHDAGFTMSYAEHEKFGCSIANASLPGFGYLEEEINKINGMIMATRLPQSPKNKLEEIICDADLDYLGRDDYFVIAEKLRNELEGLNKIKLNEKWDQIEMKFLEGHHYFTNSAKELRGEKKKQHLAKIKDKHAQ